MDLWWPPLYFGHPVLSTVGDNNHSFYRPRDQTSNLLITRPTVTATAHKQWCLKTILMLYSCKIKPQKLHKCNLSQNHVDINNTHHRHRPTISQLSKLDYLMILVYNLPRITDINFQKEKSGDYSSIMTVMFWLNNFCEREVRNEKAGGVDKMQPNDSVASTALVLDVPTWKLPSTGIQTDVWLLEIHDRP